MTETAIPSLSLLLAGLVASGTDLRSRRIPNWLCVLTLLSGLGFTLVAHGIGEVGGHALHALAALLVGMALFAVRFIGGGDAKFYAGVAAWFNLSEAWRLFVFVSMWGLVALVFWFSVRRFQGKPIRRQGGGMEGIPYEIAIALGGVTLASLGL